MSSSYIHFAVNDRLSFFVTAEKYSVVYICVFHIFFIHPTDDGHLVSFSVLSAVNSAAMNIVGQVSSTMSFMSLGMYPVVGLLYGNSISSF